MMKRQQWNYVLSECNSNNDYHKMTKIDDPYIIINNEFLENLLIT